MRRWSSRTALIWFPDNRAYFDTPRNAWCYFRKTLSLPAAPAAASLRIFADARYRLFVNGDYIARGPARSDPRWQSYDDIDLAGRLRAGENLIAVQVLYYGYNTGQHLPRVPCLAAELDLTDAAGKTRAHRTDSSWKTFLSESFDPDAPRVNGCQGAIEIFDARREPAGWTAPGFDDTAWPAAKARAIGNDQLPYNRLLPRDIPMLEETLLPAARLSAPLTVAAHDDEPFFPQRARLELDEIKTPLKFADFKPETPAIPATPAGLAIPATPASLAIPATPAGAAIPATPAGSAAIVTLDFARVTPGYLRLAATAPAGTRIDIAYAEDLYEGRVALFHPPAQRPLDAFILKQGRNDLEIAFAWKGFRYAQLIIRNPAGPLQLHRAEMRARRYPVTQYGHALAAPQRSAGIPARDLADKNVRPPNLPAAPATAAPATAAAFQRELHAICAHTLRGCMQDGFIDSPSREQQQWMGDGRWQAVYNYYLSGDPRLHRRLLAQIAHSQDAEGLTKSRYPDGHENWSPIPSYCLAWVTSFADLWDFTGDLAPAAEFWPNIIMALRWFTRYQNKDGLLENVPFWSYIDLGGYPENPGPDINRGGILTALNLLFLEALRAASRLAAALGDAAARAAFDTRAALLAAAIARHLWDDARGAYPDCKVSGKLSDSISEPVNALALLHLTDAPALLHLADDPALLHLADDQRSADIPVREAHAAREAHDFTDKNVHAATATTRDNDALALLHLADNQRSADIPVREAHAAREAHDFTDKNAPTATAAHTAHAPAAHTATPARAPRILAHFGAPGTVISSPFSMPVVIRALLRHRRVELAWRLVRERYQPILDAGLGTTWEYWKVFHPTPAGRVHAHSASHAWGAGPLLLFFEGFAGVRALAPAFARFAIAPQLPAGLDDLAYVVPTPAGKIEGRHRRSGNEIHATFTVPPGATAIVAGREYRKGSHTATLAPSQTAPPLNNPPVPTHVHPSHSSYLSYSSPPPPPTSSYHVHHPHSVH
ncbi:MAG: family 78 glycoside hydrolase catalytic domain [Opitutaceae bacterium]|nr:family 78 glycoside hydrolase catalytic domain [Opitutaceae bacterium]